jgi:hypothetical protein
MICPQCRLDTLVLINVCIDNCGEKEITWICNNCLNDVASLNTTTKNTESLRSFAKQNNLEISVKANLNTDTGEISWKCQYKGVEVNQGGYLKSEFGVGHTPEEAMANYASTISNKNLVYHAYSKDRRNLHAGNIWENS